MHELAITEGVLSIAVEAAGGQRVTTINLLVGDLSSFIDDSIQFYFDLLSRGTLAESAALHIQRVPGRVTCASCGGQFEARAPLFDLCPACGSGQLLVTGGRDLRVESIEVADGN